MAVKSAKGEYLPSLQLSARVSGYTNEFTDGSTYIAGQQAGAAQNYSSCLSNDSLRVAAMRGETVSGFETTRVRKDGSTVEVRLSVTPLKTPEGAIRGAVMTYEDVSAAKEVERARSRSEGRLRFLAEASNVLAASPTSITSTKSRTYRPLSSRGGGSARNCVLEANPNGSTFPQ